MGTVFAGWRMDRPATLPRAACRTEGLARVGLRWLTRSAPFMRDYTLAREIAAPSQSLGFPNPLMCPIFADGLQSHLSAPASATAACSALPAHLAGASAYFSS